MREILKRKNISQKTFKTCSTMHNTPFPLVLFKSYAKDFLSFFLDFTLKTSPLPNRKHCSLFSFRLSIRHKKRRLRTKKNFFFFDLSHKETKRKGENFEKNINLLTPKNFLFFPNEI